MENAPWSRFPASDYIKCISTTELALENGFDNKTSWHAPLGNPLLNALQVAQQHTSTTERQCTEVLQELLAVGFDQIHPESDTITPLLYLASTPGWRSLTMLRFFIANGADIHAVSSICEQNALHFCLSYFDVEFQTPVNGDCRCSSQHGNGMPLGESSTIFEPRSSHSHGNSEHDEDSPGGGDDPKEEDESDDNAFNATGSYNMLGTKFLQLSYCKVRDIDDFKSADDTSRDRGGDSEPEPWMFKARLRLKLLALLEAGCDPNAREAHGYSPTDWAELHEIMPQWEWALENSGWKYNEHLDRCERQSAAEDDEEEDEDDDISISVK